MSRIIVRRIYVWWRRGPSDWRVGVVASCGAATIARYTTKREAEACATRIRKAMRE